MDPTRIIYPLFFASAFLSVTGGSHSAVPFLKLATCRDFNIKSSECQHYFPIDMLTNNISNEYKLHLTFYVMTTTAANIVLTDGNNKGKVRYKAVVGGYANTYSWLRNTSDTTVGLDSHKTGILSPLWPTPIVVRQKYDGQLSVAIPGVIDPLLRADASDLEVKSVCLYAWQAESRWFYNCNEDNEYRTMDGYTCVKLQQ
ncbi:unnamed protein product [Hermetia illucens]|uniref:Farnesoic acid O-methyl transferase domain-containing protein n=1 Tax=Hermetia illucens TaxID=343691 RepID=A0A7R8Z1M3_HERIL|nr:uncharacterized protein LOC119659039 [Hermetia illucens]CAD7093724.1 unnamed protein product [Hermetia illucens]